jgi:hypothetical protein
MDGLGNYELGSSILKRQGPKPTHIPLVAHFMYHDSNGSPEAKEELQNCNFGCSFLRDDTTDALLLYGNHIPEASVHGVPLKAEMDVSINILLLARSEGIDTIPLIIFIRTMLRYDDWKDPSNSKVVFTKNQEDQLTVNLMMHASAVIKKPPIEVKFILKKTSKVDYSFSSLSATIPYDTWNEFVRHESIKNTIATTTSKELLYIGRKPNTI